jgi:hypothetical protein
LPAPKAKTKDDGMAALAAVGRAEPAKSKAKL